MGNGFKWKTDSLTPSLDGFDDKMDNIITQGVRFHSLQALTFARQNAPWTDRTSNARNGLFTRGERVKMGSYFLLVAHAVDYGIWLEIRWSGRYAIIRPTLDHEGPMLMRTLAQAFGRM